MGDGNKILTVHGFQPLLQTAVCTRATSMVILKLGTHTNQKKPRGDQILDWSLDKDLDVIDDLSAIRLNPGMGGLSSPDITFVTPDLVTKTKWTVMENAMGSDHWPNVIEISVDVIQTKYSTTPLCALQSSAISSLKQEMRTLARPNLQRSNLQRIQKSEH